MDSTFGLADKDGLMLKGTVFESKMASKIYFCQLSAQMVGFIREGRASKRRLGLLGLSAAGCAGAQR